MEEFKIGDIVTTCKEGMLGQTHPEIGFQFKVLKVGSLRDTLYFNPYFNVEANRCRLVHREEDKDQLRPDHYGGKDNPYECIKVIRAWGLGFELGNVLKYINRTGKKEDAIIDLEKAKTYLELEIEKLKRHKYKNN